MAGETAMDASVVVSEDWHLHYDYVAGPIVSHFLNALSNGKVEGRRCDKCSMVWLPPRGYCERCFVPTSDWVEVGPEGDLEAATIVTEKFDHLPDPPYVIAYCRFDGASTALVNFLQMPLRDIPGAAEQLKPGTRVRARFHDSRNARITDFHYELLDG